MYFTKEDFEKIEEYLKTQGIKDTDFPVLEDPSEDDDIVIVHNSTNYKIPLSKLTEFIGDLDVETLRQAINNLATVASSGDYNDLSNKPTIPTIPSNLVQGGVSSYSQPELPPRLLEVNRGYLWFDSTDKPIWWTGTKWVDANGNTIS